MEQTTKQCKNFYLKIPYLYREIQQNTEMTSLGNDVNDRIYS